MGLCRKIIEFIRLSFLNDADQVGGVCEVPVMENEISLINVGILIKMIHPARIEARTAALNSVNNVPFFQ